MLPIRAKVFPEGTFPPTHNASPGAWGVQNGKLLKQSKGGHIQDLGLEERSAGEDDDTDE